MRQCGKRSLWIGNSGDLRDARTVMAVGIGAVVELADSEQMFVMPRELVRCRFPLSDGGDNPDWLLQLAAEAVATLVRAKVPVLVCCSAGMSRSVCTAAAAIALAESIPMGEALVLVTKTGPVDVSPRLLAQFQKVVDYLEPLAIAERASRISPAPAAAAKKT